ncbi:MAG: RnfABCDGE type electron transport complex subunit D [Candidatus Micrarchaeota archaeon]|nr:RnfABCDGE type electron transport complex subunit D [Candidatus Micrarchaeota archaeon]
MNILNQPVSSMYIWAIALLSLLAALSAYTLHVLPLPFIFAIAVGGLAEMAMTKFYLKHPLKVPYSGLITGLIIGSLAPVNSPLALILIACVIAILSKFLIQYKSTNIFNPAALGLIIALPIFGLGVEWWAASNYDVYGIAITLSPVLVMLAHEAKRLPAALSFALVSLILALAIGAKGNVSLSTAVVLLFGINYFFAFVMLVEPKTSPNNNYAQIAYGASIAVLYLAFEFLRVPEASLAVLLLGNALYLVYRMYGRR